jgi:hypothetical protein
VSRPRLFIEAPAGLAAVSLRLHGGPNCRPPISRMGNKAGYAEVILAALGLRSGQGADAYLWAEADLDVAALLRCYPDADMLRRVAEIIRGWAGEEPRALWERLRAERKARGPREDAEGTAGWMWTAAVGHPGGGGFTGEFRALGPTQQAHMGPTTCAKYSRENGTDERGYPLAPQGCSRREVADACHRLAEYATLADGAFRQGDPESGYRDDVRQAERGSRGEPVHVSERLGERFEGMAREVAGFAFVAGGSMKGFGEGPFGGNLEGFEENEHGHSKRPLVERLPDAMGALSRSGWPPVHVTARIPEPAEVAAMLGTPGDLGGVVYYGDPPYLGTTGYAHDLPRAEVIRLARAYAAMGATVAISEAEPLFELDGPEWHVVEITGGRKGQKRTFSKQRAEFVTMNREPAHRVATQPALFGAA